MELGTGIFLAAIVMSATALFIATKDRWNWKRIVLWPLGLLVVAALWIGGVIAWEQLRRDDSDGPYAQSAHWDIALTASKADVRFIKGEPTEIVKKEGSPDVEDWYYRPKDWTQSVLEDRQPSHVIRFKGERVRFVVTEQPEDSYEHIQEIKHGYSSSMVTAKFGSEGTVSTSTDGLTRIYSYPQFNVFFALKKDAVVAYGMFNPDFGEMKFGDKIVTMAPEATN